MRLQKCGIRGVEQDVAIGIRVAKRNGAEDAELVRYLRLIRSGARMSVVQVVENAYEAWFQMYGRTLWNADQCERTRRFTSEVEECAPRPWVKPSVGVLNEAGGPMSESLRIESCIEILDICHSGADIRILWIYRHAVGFVTEYSRIHGNRKTYKLGSDFAGSELCGGCHNSGQNNVLPMPFDCMCGAFSDNLKKLVTGYADGKLVVWDIDSGYKADHCLECPGTVLRRLFRWACVFPRRHCTERATCVAISGNGRTVVSGSKYGRFYIWNIDNQEPLRNSFRKLKVYKRVAGKKIPITMLKDSKTIFDVITKTSSTSDKLLIIHILAVFEAY
ncbi:hypothetical protein BWQ96_07579 [Gracilariopsis chorda]|uniref:Uncharacterized protein n=1 Tax=Gracilariopsis chorda TaxID=448386 RepID=A0A2V3IKV8_9FLOR|nr:hypothetical protein BWQ96_07579 [Gracilariopsis chorda]|eukprot:PXF42693.1 hypothetical protein BWQ96_07579 [Gracilariopsis chorda]